MFRFASRVIVLVGGRVPSYYLKQMAQALLAGLDHVEVLRPTAVRDDIIGFLTAIATTGIRSHMVADL